MTASDNKIRCKKCNRVIGERTEDGKVIFNSREVMIPLIAFILCKGDPNNPCNTVNEFEPEKLIHRQF